MDYISANIKTDEKILCDVKKDNRVIWFGVIPFIVTAIALLISVSATYRFGSTSVIYIFCGLNFIAIALFISSIGIIVRNVLFLKYDCLVLTNKRLLGRVGVFRTTSIDIPIDKIDTLDIRTTLVGNILGYATITIRAMTFYILFGNVVNAREFVNTVMERVDKYKEEKEMATVKLFQAALVGDKHDDGSDIEVIKN